MVKIIHECYFAGCNREIYSGSVLGAWSSRTRKLSTWIPLSVLHERPVSSCNFSLWSSLNVLNVCQWNFMISWSHNAPNKQADIWMQGVHLWNKPRWNIKSWEMFTTTVFKSVQCSESWRCNGVEHFSWLFFTWVYSRNALHSFWHQCLCLVNCDFIKLWSFTGKRSSPLLQ